MWSNYGQRSLLNHFYSKWVAKFQAGGSQTFGSFMRVFTVSHDICKARSRKVCPVPLNNRKANVLVAVLCYYQSKTSKLQSTTCSLPFFVSYHQK